MMEYIIPNYPSLTGNHCSSTAIQEASMYYNTALSEAMIFGIGSGLSFSCFSFTDRYPRLVNTRTAFLESNFFKATDNDFKWYSDEALNVDKMISYIESGIPVFAITETGELDFYGTSGGRNVAGHILTIIGFNKKEKSFIITDYISKEYFTLSLSNLKKATGHNKRPYDRKNVWAPVPNFEIKNLKSSILKGMKKTPKICCKRKMITTVY
ncbi:BtrH N-terminal domain-containing protein [Bacillus cereus]|uniref:Butirosin biosynthesis protein H N-terminal domain-containing protein n=1 Tax=Bacillus cereus HuA4-10 TaxID=1053206 RepID=J8DI44_BACCE|nr:BtrH N-terminal domain-containing protein [Bacillus cereus]EJQ75864.1 hypothetical protein IGC_04515 [Bacillus cereus HuA4-10]